MFELEELAAERRAIDAREAAWLEQVHKYDASGEWRDDGYRSCAAALRHRCHLTAGMAHATVKLARRLHDLPAVRDAFHRGELSRAHAEKISRACITADRTAALVDVEATLAETATWVDAKDLGRIVDYVTGAIDGDGGAAADAGAWERRKLHVDHVGDHVAFTGSGDLESAAYIGAALDAEMERDFRRTDPRSPAQRRWDALTNLCRRALDRGEVGSSRAVRPHVSVIVDVQRFGADLVVAAQARCEVSQVGHVSQATLERILCDCDVSRVVMNGASQVLDVGRARRTPTQAQWKALVARDQGCVSCGAPSWMCQSHHIHHWTKKGLTDLANLELLCTPCHRNAHGHVGRGPPVASGMPSQADEGEPCADPDTGWSRHAFAAAT